MQPFMKKNSNRYLFSLVEVLAAISVIAILTAMIVGLSTYASRKAAESRTISRLEQMVIALDAFREDRGYYPQGGPGPLVSYFTTITHSETGRRYLDGYDGSSYKDAWDNEFFYECPGTVNTTSYDLWSRGRDGAHGKEGVNDDSSRDSDMDDASDAQVTAENDDITNFKPL